MKSVLIALTTAYNCCILIIISSLLQFTNGVPDDYCLAPLNKSDCGMPVTAVFTYWLPGSRCEIEFWRGCPTINKFPNEYVCSHYCIGDLLESFSNDILPLNEKKNKYPEDNLCDEVFDDGDCKGQPTDVYTYNKTADICQKITWRGCEVRNRFADEEDCFKMCQNLEFAGAVSNLSGKEIEDINEVLDDVEKEYDEVETTEHQEEEDETTEHQEEEDETTTEHHEETTTEHVKDDTEEDEDGAPDETAST